MKAELPKGMFLQDDGSMVMTRSLVKRKLFVDIALALIRNAPEVLEDANIDSLDWAIQYHLRAIQQVLKAKEKEKEKGND